MTSTKPSFNVYLAICSYIGLCFIGGCFGSEHCYRVVDRYVCYFVPYGARSIGEEWEKAVQVCRDNAATLPVVENKTVQALIEKFMKTQLPGLEVWTAGRGTRSNKWHWLNGHELQQTQLIDNHHYLSQIYDTQAIITSELIVSARYPSDKYHYVCQLYGPTCQSNGSIAFEGGCLKAVTNESSSWYDARNLCIENGGDLPIFENPALINKTHEVFNQLRDAMGIWIGLRRMWWNWKRTSGSLEEIKYTNWFDHDNYVNRECLLLTQNGKRWRQQYCMAAKRFFCQTIKSDLYSVQALKIENTNLDAEFPHKMTIAVGVSIPLIILVAVASVLLATKCNACLRSSDRPKPTDQQPRMNGQTPVASNTHYTDLRPLDSNIKVQQIELQQRHALKEHIWVSREPLDT